MTLKDGKIIYIVSYLLIAIIISMLFLSYYKINLNVNEIGNANLNRVAVFEGLDSQRKDDIANILAIV
jgi:hypothetical protein